MNQSDILKFLPSCSKDPAQTCQCCGCIAHYPEMKFAAIRPFVDDSICVDFVVCSPACEAAFITFPQLDQYVLKCVEEAARAHNLSLKFSFQIWKDQIYNEVNS